MAARLLIVAGVLLVLVGLVVWVFQRLGFRGLPGDLRWEFGPLRIYFPLITSLVLSALLTGAWWLWRWWVGR